ncbi:MAG: hypothetical protein ABI882_08900 [Acidobacteriota bacterium]
MEPWTKEQFDSQLEIFPEGQFCVEYQGLLVASASSLILDFARRDQRVDIYEVKYLKDVSG